MAYTISPLDALGGIEEPRTLNEIISSERVPHSKWVERLRTAIDFITPDTTLVCVTDVPFHEDLTSAKLTPIGLTQSVGVNEGAGVAYAGEIGSRRKRGMVGSSVGGSISISRMLCVGKNALATIASTKTTETHPASWTEREWAALTGMNHDRLRYPVGIVLIEAGPDGKPYAASMYEQCLIQGTSKGYQAGQSVVVENINLIFEQVVPLWDIKSGGSEVDYGSTI